MRPIKQEWLRVPTLNLWIRCTVVISSWILLLSERRQIGILSLRSQHAPPRSDLFEDFIQVPARII